ncbi:MAG TPA: nucleotide exchange factor GrpE [Chlorobaculum parvum]|uniref:Nucleotide exchange factor GrpE n=1 Tax=Chlorobaculum parvum TaxID=274539 RepID=A0A7C5HJZ7_9CHLB|nr:nucleotide exchange factor GrpE [Chlorobaculum parvum]
MWSGRGILRHLFSALKGDDGDDAQAVAELRVELVERDNEIARLKKEYALQREQCRAQVERAGGEAIEGIASQCAAPLATLSAMQARYAEKGDLNPADLLQLASSFRKILVERGLEEIGTVGQTQPYDPAFHQMLDGIRPQPGEPVLIRFAGFRFNGKLVAKAQAGAAKSR